MSNCLMSAEQRLELHHRERRLADHLVDPERRENGAFVDREALQELLDVLGKKERQAMLAFLGFLECLDQKEMLDYQDFMEFLERRENLDYQELPDLRALKEQKEILAHLSLV